MIGPAMAIRAAAPLAAALVAGALSACASTRPPELPPADAARGPCRTETLAAFVGRPASAVLAADAIAESGAATLRWARPDDALTMDYRPDRLTVKIDRKGIVTGFACG